jgi:hypothetical protein
MPLEGGLRDRMVIESLGNHIQTHLTALGWFDPLREHKPINVISGFPNDTDEVELNTMAFSVENAFGEDMEMGSDAEVHQTAFFVDMFMEDDAVGWHLSGDVYFFLKKNRHLDVFDYSTGGNPVDFKVELMDIDRRKPVRAVNAWQRHWFTVSFVAEDDRTNA